MLPVDASKLRPAGSAGLMVYELTAPETVGLSGVMASPTLAEMVACG
jgi:hypothetical protein